ncbi:VOC family protein [Aeromicrobium sp.]|uniref:VOC family protein n=1 Tax=Aeromicrobium sp. TaxID=1871063 RepID=UPI0025BF6A21|nr:VOC family protein [Aeromicrobium sp.]MCK5892616.1 VOC family protein [Aeromicrobium sp.]
MTSVDHVAIAVRDLAAAAHLFVDVLGATLMYGGDNDATGVRILKLALADFRVELMQPISDDSRLARDLDRRGEGFHHVTLMVDDVARTVSDLAAAGLTTVGTDLASPRWSETFLSPRDTFGALVQVASASDDFGARVDEYTLDDVLAGRVAWVDKVACLR